MSSCVGPRRIATRRADYDSADRLFVDGSAAGVDARADASTTPSPGVCRNIACNGGLLVDGGGEAAAARLDGLGAGERLLAAHPSGNGVRALLSV